LKPHNTSIIAFEPDPAAFECLTSNVKNNGLIDIQLNRCAVGGIGGQIDFNSSAEDNLRMSTLPNRCGNGTRITVDVRRLSKFIDRPVDLVKIDIEGAEVDVMQELAASGKLPYAQKMHCYPDQSRRAMGARGIFSGCLALLLQVLEAR
jgi:FkbM family methyltransferase